MKRRNKGFTLPEMIMNLAVLAIVAAAVGAVLIICINIFTRNALNSHAAITADGIYELISDKLTYGRDISLSYEPSGNPSSVLCISGSDILVGDNNKLISAFSDEFYSGFTFSVTISQNNLPGNIAEICVQIFNYTELICSRKGAVRMLNCDYAVFEKPIMDSLSRNIFINYDPQEVI